MDVETLLKDLNDEQREATVHDQGPLLVIAGAGTGKTRVITSRVAYLILSQKAKPQDILALTFTDKAAQEMLGRVDEIMPLGYEEMSVSTFHAFCEQVLRESALKIGLSSDFQLLSQAQQWLILKDHLFDFDLHYYRPVGNPMKFIHGFIGHLSRIKDELIRPSHYLRQAALLLSQSGIVNFKSELVDDLDSNVYRRWPLLVDKATLEWGGLEWEEIDRSVRRARLLDELESEKEEALKHWELANLYHDYQKLLLTGSQAYLDFGDVISYTHALWLYRPGVLKEYQNRYKYVLVDEYQDTNYAQNELVKLLVKDHKNIMVVGDDDQSIYRFRGASVSNILQFSQTFKEVKRVVLTKNYRSVQSILDASHALVQHNNPDRLEVLEGIDKKLVGHQGQGREPIILHAKNAQDEAELVVRSILSLRGQWDGGNLAWQRLENSQGAGFEQTEFDVFMESSDTQNEDLTADDLEDKEESKPALWGDFAILARANNHLEIFVETLRYYGVPFQIKGSRGLYVKDEIKDLVAYLRFLLDEEDSMSLYRLLSWPILNLPAQAVMACMKWSYKENRTLWETLFLVDQLDIESEVVEKIVWLREWIEKERALILQDDAGRLLHRFISQVGLLESLANEGDLESEVKILNIRKFFDQIKSFMVESEDKSAWGFIRYLDMLIEAGDNPSTAEMDMSSDAVQIMTVHSSKGLEFDYVFVVDLVKNRFPSRRRSLEIAILDDLIKEELPQGDGHLQEERRLFYVAMTRARKMLFLSFADNYGGKTQTKPSPFVGEALGQMVDLKVAQELDQGLNKARLDSQEREVDLQEFTPRLFSYSQFSSFERCPLQYKYGYVLRVPTPDTASSNFGQVIHRTLKDFYEVIGSKGGQEINFATLKEIYDRHWQRRGFMNVDHLESEYERGVEVLERFFDDNSDSWSAAAFLEKQFVWKVDDIGVTGYIDRIDELSDGSYEVIDYKTGSSGGVKKLEKRVAKEEQLMIYALACRDVLDLNVSKFTLYFLEDGLMASTNFSAEELESLADHLVVMAHKIRRARFEAKPSVFNCQYCSYKDICPESMA